jgi:hypothetical protein
MTKHAVRHQTTQLLLPTHTPTAHYWTDTTAEDGARHNPTPPQQRGRFTYRSLAVCHRDGGERSGHRAPTLGGPPLTIRRIEEDQHPLVLPRLASQESNVFG